MAEWKQILVRVKNEIASDHISVVSAGIAFYALLSVFPALAALISIAGLVLDPADIASQLDTVMPDPGKRRGGAAGTGPEGHQRR